MHIRDKSDFALIHNLTRPSNYHKIRKRRLHNLLQNDIRTFNQSRVRNLQPPALTDTRSNHQHRHQADRSNFEPLNDRFSRQLSTIDIVKMAYPPRESRYRLSKSSKITTSSLPDDRLKQQATFTPRELDEVMRMRDEDDKSFFIIASLLDKDEKAVGQAYYKRSEELDELEDEMERAQETEKKTAPVSVKIATGKKNIPKVKSLNLKVKQEELGIRAPCFLSTSTISNMQKKSKGRAPPVGQASNLQDRSTRRSRRSAADAGLLLEEGTGETRHVSKRIKTNMKMEAQASSRTSSKATTTKAKSTLTDKKKKTPKLKSDINLHSNSQAEPFDPKPEVHPPTEGTAEAQKSQLRVIRHDEESPEAKEVSSAEHLPQGPLSIERTNELPTADTPKLLSCGRAKKMFVVPASRPNEPPRLSFTPRYRFKTTRAQVARFLDPMLLRRFNPALRIPTQPPASLSQ